MGTFIFSPFGSPLIDAQHRWWPLSPGVADPLIFPFTLGFRATCYYYRKAYYRSFFLDPPACAVAESPKRNYCGETKVPFYSAKPAPLLHVRCARLSGHSLVRRHRSLRFPTCVQVYYRSRQSGSAGQRWFLTSVHPFVPLDSGHLVGRKTGLARVRASGARHSAWSRITFLNERHMVFAWISLIGVGLADFYVREVAIGAIRDLRLL